MSWFNTTSVLLVTASGKKLRCGPLGLRISRRRLVIRAKLRALVCSTALAATLLGGVVGAPAAEAKELTLAQFYASKKYPYAGYGGGTSPARYTKGYCVDYAVWAWHHWTGTKFHNVRVANFKSTALSRGYKVGKKPKKGALAVWASGRTHMAYVLDYKAGASNFKVREVRWNTTGPSNRVINNRDIANSGNRRGPDWFIYKK